MFFWTTKYFVRITKKVLLDTFFSQCSAGISTFRSQNDTDKANFQCMAVKKSFFELWNENCIDLETIKNMHICTKGT